MERWAMEWVIQMMVQKEQKEKTMVDCLRMEVAPSDASDQSLSDQCAADCMDDPTHQLIPSSSK